MLSRENREVELPHRDKDSYCIQSVENALNVLEALCEGEEEVRISSLSEKLGMNKTSVFRLLATFESRGYVERGEGSGRYKLGLFAYEMGQKFLSRMSLLKKARPVMERLVRECKEAVYLTVRHRNEVLFLDVVDTPHQVKIVSLVGKRYPITSTPAGKVLAEKVSEEDRKKEVGFDTGTLGEGIACISVPLVESSGNMPASLSMVGPDFRLTKEKIDEDLRPALVEAGMVISSKLGYVGHYIN